MTIINPFIIMKEVEKYFNLKHGVLIKRNRKKTVAKARAVAMYLVRSWCKMSYPEIGEYFERDKSTVINACNNIKVLYLCDPFSDTINDIEHIAINVKERIDKHCR